MTQKQIGGYEFHYECTRIVNASSALRDDIGELIKNPGPQTLSMLAAKMAVEVMHIVDAINKIKDIGDIAKNNRK